jgi:hypothetical protein
MNEMVRELKEIKSQAKRIEDKMEKRLDRLEDKLDSRINRIESDINSFKIKAFLALGGITTIIEIIKRKIGL